ncbi:MAG: acireductone synthase, partial [Alphaproteobacteria bacterium]|nr:acireductone synthase [Alphaproteobacteria bacterium]
RYIEEDQKVTPLKELQGLIWEEGYKDGELKGHIYDDALECLKDWHKSGIKIYIYSSGSIHAQRLLFGNTESGDLNGLFDGNFDTTTGPKKEVESYEKIITEIGMPAEDILFLSDCVEEIDAAAKAGMNVVILDREKCLTDNQPYSVVQSFNEIFGDNQDHHIEAHG